MKKSLISRVFSVVKTTARAIIALFQGRPVTVPISVHEERKNICDLCRYYRRRSDVCAKCGCVVELKTLLAREKCPLRSPKWLEYNGPGEI